MDKTAASVAARGFEIFAEEGVDDVVLDVPTDRPQEALASLDRWRDVLDRTGA